MIVLSNVLPHLCVYTYIKRNKWESCDTSVCVWGMCERRMVFIVHLHCIDMSRVHNVACPLVTLLLSHINHWMPHASSCAKMSSMPCLLLSSSMSCVYCNSTIPRVLPSVVLPLAVHSGKCQPSFQTAFAS